ncbi:hypothetical protein SS1G_10522 [Sclerotinia sclerotiorum 1980 UF-70]|uniref:Uncharacterized protein n=1 Tax=Sclerotinia sclerotiorum (strain ATCC 18683 / 1980 / Ss-1) TaxID=665079 RepID=A7EYV6_SCLS1|nr:hypothetical protein SS1G_10522 [Sclerotinia sclerotiorum 1980 UF-70]EDN94648.1 hypothetical protein SS1G_10522 [Sclerotinia sclerotiorum 1980 UF-70]
MKQVVRKENQVVSLLGEFVVELHVHRRYPSSRRPLIKRSFDMRIHISVNHVDITLPAFVEGIKELELSCYSSFAHTRKRVIEGFK